MMAISSGGSPGRPVGVCGVPSEQNRVSSSSESLFGEFLIDVIMFVGYLL